MKKGFTLIELVVTIGIFIIISTLVFANYPEFKSNMSLKKTAQEIALTIRQAQVYALGVKGFEEEFSGYGVNFNLSNQDSFILFSDSNGDFYYNAGEQVENYRIETGDKISELCGADVTREVCGLSQLNVVFWRPSPIVKLNDGAGNDNFSSVKIRIKSTRGNTKTIIVRINGQISVE